MRYNLPLSVVALVATPFFSKNEISCKFKIRYIPLKGISLR